MLGEINDTIDGLQGNITTYSLDVPFTLVPVTNRKDDKSPTHNIIMTGRHGRAFGAGVAWQGNHREYGNYISMTVEVPELFKGAMNLMAGQLETGVYGIRYAKDQEKKAA
jgi:uncharacterized protein (DUF736 family)